MAQAKGKEGEGQLGTRSKARGEGIMERLRLERQMALGTRRPREGLEEAHTLIPFLHPCTHIW